MTLETVTIQQSVKRGLVKAVSEHPIIAYFLLAYAGTWLLMSPLILGLEGLGIFHFHVSSTIGSILFLASTFAGPTLSAFLVTSAMEGKIGVKNFLRRYILWQVKFKWYLVAIFGAPLLYFLLSTIWLGFSPIQSLVTHWTKFFTFYLPALLIFPALITWGEEPGWRGFALTQLQKKYNPLVSSLILGFLHGVWHLPIFVMVGGPNPAGPFNPMTFVINTLGIMTVTIIWAWVFNNARQSILIAVLLHSSLNSGQAFVRQILPSFPPQIGIVSYAVLLAIALLIVILTKGRLGLKQNNKGIETLGTESTLSAS